MGRLKHLFMEIHVSVSFSKKNIKAKPRALEVKLKLFKMHIITRFQIVLLRLCFKSL